MSKKKKNYKSNFVYLKKMYLMIMLKMFLLISNRIDTSKHVNMFRTKRLKLILLIYMLFENDLNNNCTVKNFQNVLVMGKI